MLNNMDDVNKEFALLERYLDYSADALISYHLADSRMKNSKKYDFDKPGARYRLQVRDIKQLLPISFKEWKEDIAEELN